MPRQRRSLLVGIVIGISTLVVGSYGALAFTQRELGGQRKDEIPSSIRSSPGGYRSYSYWHSGYHGGK